MVVATIGGPAVAVVAVAVVAAALTAAAVLDGRDVWRVALGLVEATVGTLPGGSLNLDRRIGRDDMVLKSCG